MADDVEFNNGPTRKSPLFNPKDVEMTFRGSPMGALDTALGDNFRGLNHRQAPSLIQINKDYFGMTFFTRPRLNLQDENIRNIRLLSPLLSTDPMSLQRYIRCILDPESNRAGRFTSPLVDARQAFIPIFTNLLESLPGWPDKALPYSTSAEGVMKEQFNIADGTTKIYNTRELTANFRNVQGDPITAMIDMWQEYVENAYLGKIIPYPDSLLENEKDYETRIYRLILDSTKRYVYGIGTTGAGFPVSNPIGAKFNYESHHAGAGPLNEGLKQVSVHFVNSGIMYNDPISVWEFNRTTELFNPLLAEITPARTSSGAAVANNARSPIYQKIAIDELQLFNYNGYPRIDLGTYELEWFVRKEDYNAVLPLINQQRQQEGRK